MIRLALAQVNTTVGDLRGNVEKIIAALEKSRKEEADVVLFPELCLTGYPPEDLLFKKSFIRETIASLKKILPHAKSICAVIGLPIEDGGKLYNAAAVILKGEIEYMAKKSELPNYGVFDEKRYFVPGKKNSLVKIAGVNVAITICEDIWAPDGQSAALCGKPETGLIFNLSSSPFHIGKIDERRGIARAWAKKFKTHLAYCNLVGGQDELVFDGGSFVCDPQGEIISSSVEFDESLHIVDLPLGSRNKKGTAKKASVTPPFEYPENVFEALKTGVRDYVEKNGFTKALIALSGGIDSALTASVAVAALGADRVRCVSMPSRYSSQESVSDAKELANSLGIRMDVIPITPLMDGFDAALKNTFAETEPGIAEENLQARIRGALIMAISNKFGYLVLSTGNKSELSVGYCTLYGDMAGGFAVIKDLPKTLVYELSNWINDRKNLPDIPRSIIEKEPSAELRPDQKDSDSLPEYRVLDPILKLYVEDEKSIEEIISLGYSERDVAKAARLVDFNEHKRRQAPLGVRITPKAFGRDRRVPITNRFREWEK